LKNKREKRGGPKRKGGGGIPHKKNKQFQKGGKQGMNLSNRSIKALATAMKECDVTEGTTPDEDSDSDEDEDVEMAAPATSKQKKGSNRNNPALRRQKRK
jgi:hypothetical protein